MLALLIKLPPVTLPAALILVPALKFDPSMLPAADTVPLVRRLPDCTLAVTAKLPKVPTVVKLDVITLELKVVPVIKAAAGDDNTPVNKLPSPTKNPPAVTLPTAEIAVLPTNVPLTVAPTEVTVTTLATFETLIKIEPLFKIAILLVPLAMPETPPVTNN
jgi:hypothetical protein